MNLGECGIIILKKAPGDSNNIHFKKVQLLTKEKYINKSNFKQIMNTINKNVYSKCLGCNY